MKESEDTKQRKIWGEAFAYVVAQTTLPPEMAAELASDFWPGDNPRRERQILRQLLLHREWAWPLFDKWAARFAEGGSWPGMWHDYGAAHAEEDDEAMRDERIEILKHTLTFTASRFRKVAQHLEWGGADPSAPHVLDIAIAGDAPGRVERKIAEPFRAAINAGDYSNLPPFFPGDRTGLTPKRRQ